MSEAKKPWQQLVVLPLRDDSSSRYTGKSRLAAILRWREGEWPDGVTFGGKRQPKPAQVDWTGFPAEEIAEWLKEHRINQSGSIVPHGPPTERTEQILVRTLPGYADKLKTITSHRGEWLETMIDALLTQPALPPHVAKALEQAGLRVQFVVTQEGQAASQEQVQEAWALIVGTVVSHAEQPSEELVRVMGKRKG